MKLVNFLYVFVFVIFNCINTFANKSEDDFILNKIKSDTHTCISADIYSHNLLRKCLTVFPDVNMTDVTEVDILCMSLYDSFLLLCEQNQNEKLKEKIPQDLKQFSKLVDSLDRNQTAEKFCSTDKEKENLKNNNKFDKTAQWINLFISSMKEKDRCLRICSTIVDLKFNPLCSFIVWVNELNSENSNTVVETLQATVSKSDDIAPVTDDDTPEKISTVNGNAVTVNGSVANPKPEPKPEKENNKDDTARPANEGAGMSPEDTFNMNSNLAPPGENAEEQREAQSEQKVKEIPKNNQVADNGDTSTVRPEPDSGGVIMHVSSENDQETKTKESINKEDTEHATIKLLEKKPEASPPSSGNVIHPAVDNIKANSNIPLVKANPGNDDNGKDINDTDGGIIMSNEEENNENGGDFIVDGNGGADGLEREEESDDVQIPSSKDALPAAPVQNKQQTFHAQHAGINTAAETVVEGGVIVRGDPFVEAEESHFFTYFISMAVLSIIMYLVFHNKKKLVALAVEGRRTRSTTRRRPNTASYSKLDCNLEEAMVSNTTASVTHVLY